MEGPNILFGSQVDLDFNAFVVNLTPVIIVVLAAQTLWIHLKWGRQLSTIPEAKARVMDMIPREAIMDWVLLRQSLAVLTAVMVAFVLARAPHISCMPDFRCVLTRRNVSVPRP